MAVAEIIPANVPVKTVKGDNEPFSFILKDKDTGTPINVTGYTARIQLRQLISDAVVLTLTSADDIAVGTTNGVITVSPITVNTHPVGDYRYDLQVTRPNATKRTMTNGIWQIQYEATTG